MKKMCIRDRATRVFDRCGGRAINVIEDSGKNMLIYKLLKDKGEELQYFNRISKQQGFVGIVSKSITEFKKYNICLLYTSRKRRFSYCNSSFKCFKRRR